MKAREVGMRLEKFEGKKVEIKRKQERSSTLKLLPVIRLNFYMT